MLRAVDLTYAFGAAPVLHDVSLQVAPGEIVGIIGPNGAGKTTLIRLLAGLLRPTRGAVLLDEVPLAGIRRPDLARRLAVVPQETHLAFEYTGLEIAMMGRYAHLGAFELEGPDDLEAARRALELTGTLGLAARPFSTLSGGEKQRVVIASALAQLAPAAAPDDPEAWHTSGVPGRVLLLDEPTASLDLRYQIEITGVVRRLNADAGVTVVVATHDLNLAAGLCHRLILLGAGRILDEGPPEATLTADALQALYGVAADVARVGPAGRLIVLPASERSRPHA